ncbi:hypothetical protein A4X13_0g9589, partial [Tilletia indica]
QRERPEAHRQATLYVAGLAPDALPDLKNTAWEYVYEPYILGRTWALLSRERELLLPQDIDRLVQAVYDDGELPSDIDQNSLNYIEIEAYGARWLEPDAKPLPNALAKKLHARQLKTSRTALVKHAQALESPCAFREHPLLRHIKPLVLTDGCLQLGRLTVLLDDELGLVYQRGAASGLPE